VEDDPFLERPLAGCSEGKSESGSIIISRAYNQKGQLPRTAPGTKCGTGRPGPMAVAPGSLSGRGPAGAGPGPALQGAAQAEAGFVGSALSFPDRAPGSERAIVADVEWRSTDLGPV
jgi:hypothetical protein